MIAGSITVTGSTSTSITIRLSSIKDAVYYRIAYRKSSETSPTIVEISGLVYTITGLSSATEYAINYRGCNADGMGPYMDAPLLQSTAAPLSLWSWTASNGTATDEQVKAAYTALTKNCPGTELKGLATEFSRLVWNDLVSNTLAALVESGLSWDSIYTTLADAKMTAAGDALTAKRFNSLVKNLRYPWMYWACKPERTGYTGRLGFSSGNAVYGAYLLELAHTLNVMVDAVGELGAGYAVRLRADTGLKLRTGESILLRSPAARHLVLSDDAQTGCSIPLRSPAARNLIYAGSVNIKNGLILRVPKADNLVFTQQDRSINAMTLTADNNRELNHAGIVSGSMADMLLSAPAASGLTLDAPITGALDAALSIWIACNLAALLQSGTASDASLETAAAAHLMVSGVSALSKSLTMKAPAAGEMTCIDSTGLTASLLMRAPFGDDLALTAAIRSAAESPTLRAPAADNMEITAAERTSTGENLALAADAVTNLAVLDTVPGSTFTGALIWFPALNMGYTGAVIVDGGHDLKTPTAVFIGMTDEIVSRCTVVLISEPKVKPTSDWVVVDGTNLKIFRTYYNRADDDDGTKLLIDDAYYVEPVQVGSNLAITSEGYNDYGLEGDSENST